MRKILCMTVLTALFVVGCQKTEVINKVGNAIEFSTEMSKLTKAAGESTDPTTYPDAEGDGNLNLQAQKFRLWVYADYEDPNTTDKTELDNIYDGMSGLEVTYDQATSKWYPVDKEYYWPGKEKSLIFFAVSDKLDETNEYKVTPAINRADDKTTIAPTLTIANYAVNYSAPNTDLMVADFRRQDQTNPTVKLDFRHTLSKIQFLFKTSEGSERDVYVQSVSVSGIRSKATLTVSENAGSTTNPMDFKWTNHADYVVNEDYEDDHNLTEPTFPTDQIEKMNATATTVDNTVLKLTKDAKEFATWLVIPQNIPGLKVEVCYVIGTREFKSIFPLDEGVSTVKVGNDNVASWLPNQYVRYTVTLAPNVISFNPSVDNWTQYDADTTNGKDNADNNIYDDIQMQN